MGIDVFANNANDSLSIDVPASHIGWLYVTLGLLQRTSCLCVHFHLVLYYIISIQSHAGDTAMFADGVYRIMGRTSVDIIKSGGYKISALDVERQLLQHDAIREVYVVGLPDVTWGQKVAVVVTLQEGGGKGATTLTLKDLRDWARDKMAPYQIPTVLKVVKDIPRNAMGKVNKKQLVAELFAKERRG